MPEVLFIKTELVYLHFSVSLVTQLIAPSFSLANSLILADVLSAVHERYTNTLVLKAGFDISYDKNSLETESIFLQEVLINCKKTKNDNKKNQDRWITGSHIFFDIWPYEESCKGGFPFSHKKIMQSARYPVV